MNSALQPKLEEPEDPSEDYCALQLQISQMRQEIKKVTDDYENDTKEVQNLQILVKKMAEVQEKMHMESLNSASKLRNVIRAQAAKLDFLAPPKPLSSPVVPQQTTLPPASTSALTVIPATVNQTEAMIPQLKSGMEKPNCIFCNFDGHTSENCRLTPTQKKAFMKSHNLCLICLEPLNDKLRIAHPSCPSPQTKCSICLIGYHHPMFCAKVMAAAPAAPCVKTMCELCKKPGHKTSKCLTFIVGLVPAHRRIRMLEKRLCLLCFQPLGNCIYDSHENCPKKGNRCDDCLKKYVDPKKHSHHKWFCIDDERVKVVPKPKILVAPAAPAAPVTPALAKFNCIFCNFSNHNSENCSVVKSVPEKISTMRSKHKCLRCLEPINNINLIAHLICPKPLVECTKCRSDFHNPMFCDGSKTNPTIPVPAPPTQNKDNFGIKRELNGFCQFCKTHFHNTMDCPELFLKTSADQRKSKLFQENRCFQCFAPNNDRISRVHTTCPNRDHICKLCVSKCKDTKQAAHHPLLCEFNDFPVEKKPRTC